MNPVSNSAHKPVIYWLLSGCLLIYIMVLVGGLTRLTHSGLSITDWSFMGSVPPLNESMWMERFQKYQQSPEFIKVNYTMSLEEFKPIFLWEYVHRMIGRTMMYVFLIGFIYFFIRNKINKSMWPSFLLLFLMGALQGLIGWWMVYSGLQKQPAVSHYRLATHLLSAFTLFAFTFWFALKLTYPLEQQQAAEGRKLLFPGLVFFVLLVLQIIYGAFTAGFVEHDAVRFRPGHIFNTWPKMGEYWIPEQVYMRDTWFENLFENPSGIQFVHRSLALMLVLCLIWIWVKASRLKLSSVQNLSVTLLIYGLTAQFVLGVYTLINQVPVFLGALHQTGAFFLFAASIYFMFHNFRPKPTS
ncbi:MAG TPA: COX15/CtaA family protein [Bacteroidia bacterium]|nr:COX15/CtaA family protein [Bacteroidia bacterium]